MAQQRRGGALVTGAGRRLGREVALALAAEGYAIAVHCNRSREEADAVVDLIRRRGGQAATVAADLADATAVSSLVAHAAGAVGPLTLLVNSASEFRPDEIGAMTAEGFDRAIAVNLRAPVFLSGAFAAQVPADAADPAIVNMIDQRVLNPRPDYFSYFLSKSALLTATQTLAQALAPRIRVNGIGPGPTLPNDRQSQAEFEAEARATLLGRGSPPAAIIEALLYLARARSVTGQMIAVDGGQHLAWTE